MTLTERLSRNGTYNATHPCARQGSLLKMHLAELLKSINRNKLFMGNLANRIED